MAVTFQEADALLVDMAQELIRLHHPWLKEARIGFMYRSEASGKGRHRMVGHARKVSEEMQVFLNFDFIIWIAEDAFAEFSTAQRRALVDHELCHCGGMDGEWKMRKHDFEEFHVIIQRHGLWDESLQLVKQALDQPELPHVTVEIKTFSGLVSSVPSDLLKRATEDPNAVAEELVNEARGLAAENGGKLTISFLQRRLRIGYSRAAQILDLIDVAQSGTLPAEEG